MSGAIVSAIESAQQFSRVWGLMPGVTLAECDAIYIGDVIIDGMLRCPRCGVNCFVETAPRTPPKRADDRDFIAELVIDLELPIRARNLINQAGAITVGELLERTASDLRSAVQGDVEPEIEEITEFLALRCLSLRDET